MAKVTNKRKAEKAANEILANEELPKRATKKPVVPADAPSTLTMSLFAPGMTVLHRAGLGGLACTLKYIERALAMGALWDDDVPGGPWKDGPPWKIDAQTVTLDFGKPEAAGEFLKRLFKIGFGLKDGLIYLPGQYSQEPSLAVRSELQAGLTLTFLQHGRVRDLAKDPTTFQFDPIGDGKSLVTIEYKRCGYYKHQDGYEALIDSRGCLRRESVEVIGPLNPGAMVRHTAFSSATKIEETAERVLPLYFAIVGCLALPVNRAVAVLVAPDIGDVRAFAEERPSITPTSVVECRIGEKSDAVLQAKCRLRARGLYENIGIPAFYAMTFKPTSWASQQKSRTWALYVTSEHCIHRYEPEHVNIDEKRLRQFEIALAELPARVVNRTKTSTQGKGKKRKAIERTESFWADSVVRPLVAENLALGKAWFTEFCTLMTVSATGGTAALRKLSYERKGLRNMTERIPWDAQRYEVLVKAVHLAIRYRLGKIRKDTDGERPLSQATINRWDRFRERLRLSLVGAKTADQCRTAICTLFGTANDTRANPELRSGWQVLLPLLADPREWQQARDLALLALASYAGQEDESQDTIDGAEKNDSN